MKVLSRRSRPWTSSSRRLTGGMRSPVAGTAVAQHGEGDCPAPDGLIGQPDPALSLRGHSELVVQVLQMLFDGRVRQFPSRRGQFALPPRRSTVNCPCATRLQTARPVPRRSFLRSDRCHCDYRHPVSTKADLIRAVEVCTPRGFTVNGVIRRLGGMLRPSSDVGRTLAIGAGIDSLGTGMFFASFTFTSSVSWASPQPRSPWRLPPPELSPCSRRCHSVGWLTGWGREVSTSPSFSCAESVTAASRSSPKLHGLPCAHRVAQPPTGRAHRSGRPL